MMPQKEGRIMKVDLYPEWLSQFHETCRDLTQDALLLRALARYAREEWDEPLVRAELADAQLRLTDYLHQHIWELSRQQRALARRA